MASDAAPDAVDGRWYEPGSSRAVPARLTVGGKTLAVQDGMGRELAAGALPAVIVSERVGSIPRHITFADGSVFETPDNDGVDALIRALGRRHVGFVHALERFRPRLAGFVLIVAVLAVVLYRFAVPVLVEAAVWATPPVVPQVLSRSALASLDETLLAESELPEAQRAVIGREFAELAALTPRGRDGYELHFRRGGPIGPNAFALPDGAIVLTDELVAMAGDDRDAVLGVLAHEIGHVDADHSLRRLYRAVGVTALIMMIGGDIGAGAEDILIQGGALLSLSYSRDQEREADRFSVELMHQAGRDPFAIARFFELLGEQVGDAGTDSFLSTHPATAERIAEARRLAEQISGGGQGRP